MTTNHVSLSTTFAGMWRKAMDRFSLQGIRLAICLLLGCLITADTSAASLEVEYQFDGDVLDSSGNGRDGTLATPAFVPGVVGQALQFNGAGPAMTTGQNATDLGINGSAPKSVTAWVNTQAFDGGGFFSIGPNANSEQFSLRTVGANQWRAQFWGGADFDFTSVPTNSNWAHMALVYDGSEARAYVNGQLAGSKVVALNTHPTNDPLVLGNWAGTNFTGTVDEFRLYSGSALTQTQINAEFQSGEHHAATLDQAVNVGAQHNKTAYVDADFNSGSLDSLLFDTKVSPIPHSPSVTMQNGEVNLHGRGHLNTTGQFNPHAEGLEVSGRWTSQASPDLDFFQVLTRSNGQPDPGNCCGETQSGLEFQKATGSSALQLQVRGGVFSISDLVQTGSLNYYVGGIYDFRITDTGESVMFQMTEVGNPANTAMLTANITGDTNTDFVTFHNREGNHTARLDNLRISSLNSTLGVNQNGFQVRQVLASGLTIDSIADADALLALNPGDAGHASEASETRSLINYVDGGGNGNYGGDNPFALGGGLNDFAMLATATLQSPTDETWTFAVNIDDGARLRINGVDVILEDRIGGTADFFGTIALSQGLHDLELMFFEQGGGAAVELFYARGTHTAFDPEAFTLLTIGATIVPEPHAWALGLIGAVFLGGLCLRRRGANSAVSQHNAGQFAALFLAVAVVLVTAPVASGALLGYWTFDDDTIDDSFGPYNGVLNSGAYSSDTPATLAGGRSLDLTGGDHYAYLPGTGPGAFNLANNLSVSTWVKGWPGDDWHTFVSKNGEGTWGWQLRRYAGSNQVGWTTRGPTDADMQGATTAASDGQWHHLLSTYDGSVKRIYVDGLLDRQINATGNIAAPTGEEVFFGARKISGGTINGFSRVQMDDVSIYSNALSPRQVYQLSQGVAATALTTPALDLVENFEGTGGELPENWYRSGGNNTTRLRTNQVGEGTYSLRGQGDGGSPAVALNVHNSDSDRPTGMTWGPVFQVLDDSAQISLIVTGGNHAFNPASQTAGGAGVALWDHSTNTIVPGSYRTNVAATVGSGNHDWPPALIPLSGLAGRELSIVMIDRQKGSWAWTGIDQIEVDAGAIQTVPLREMKVHQQWGWDTAGDFDGWTKQSGNNFSIGNMGLDAGGVLRIAPDSFIDELGFALGQKGFLSSGSSDMNNGHEIATGAYVSPNFTVEGDILEFYLSGGTSNLAFEMVRASDDVVLLSAVNDGDRNDFAYNFWDVRPFLGDDVYLRLRDDNSGTAWGHIELDAVRLVSLASVIPEPSSYALGLIGLLSVGMFLRLRRRGM